MFKNRVKKVLFSLIIINIICANIFAVYSDDENEDVTDSDISEIASQVTGELSLDETKQVSASASDEPDLNARIAVAYDRKSGNVIWGKQENRRTAMASTTKIMTAIILLENSDLNETVTVSAKAAGTGGSRLGLKKNDKITIMDLLYGLMLKSGNDSAVAIAETIGGSVEGFAEMMNAKAKELGLENTHYVTPHGLDDPEHYTTAFELAKLADYALKNDTFAKVVSTKNYTVTINGYPKNISNTNELLGYLDGVNGVKTGFTNNAGRCLVTSVNRNNFEIITVVLQADTKKFRTSDSIKLIEYVYKNYELVNLKEIVDDRFNNWCEINKNRIVINKCKNSDMNVYISNLENDVTPVKNTDKDNIDIEVNNLFYFEAPVEKDTIIGNVKVVLNGNIIDVIEIRNSNVIEKKNVWDYIKIFPFVLNGNL